MGKISDFLAGIKILEEVDSPINGKITVVKSIAFGTYLQVGGLTQSGGIIRNIWNRTLEKVSKEPDISGAPSVLILGLGGGSIVEVVKKYWPNAKITAVDFDSEMVRLGKKYLNLESRNVKIVISDANDFLTTHTPRSKTHYNLILVDLYVGDEYPKKFQSIKFIQLIKQTLASNGKAVINRLYYDRKRSESVKLGLMLEKVFTKVDVIYPEANIMFVCHK